MSRKIVKITSFLIIICLIGKCLYNMFSWKDTTSTNINTWQHYYATENNTMDVIFYGNSHCYCTINPAILWNEYEIASFDLCASGQNIGSTYYYMKESLKTQKPQVMVVELYSAIANDFGTTNGNIYRNTLTMSQLSENYNQNIQYAVEFSNEDNSLYNSLLLQIPVIHSRYNNMEKTDFVDDYYYSRGYCDGENITPFETPLVVNEEEQIDASEEIKEYLDKMLKLADDNDTDIVFFVAPYCVGTNEQKIMNGITSYLKDKNVTIWDFNKLYQDINFDYETDMREVSHVNNMGASKVTKWIGDFLNDNYKFEKDKTEDCYSNWVIDNMAWEHKIINSELKSCKDIYEYIDYLVECEDYTIIAWNNTPESLSEKLWNMNNGISLSDSGEINIIQNGNIVFNENEENEFTYHIELENYSDLGVWCSDENREIRINDKSYNINSGLNIVVYDNLLDEIVETVVVNNEGKMVR